jgi:uncharacterized membrane protein YeaQ/YmgE (transglycosylase-associated protein family)
MSNFVQYRPSPRGIVKTSGGTTAGRSDSEDAKMNISGESLLVILAVGIAAGWLAGQIVQGTGLGLIGDLVVGIAGAFIASWLFPQLGIHLGSGICLGDRRGRRRRDIAASDHQARPRTEPMGRRLERIVAEALVGAVGSRENRT